GYTKTRSNGKLYLADQEVSSVFSSNGSHTCKSESMEINSREQMFAFSQENRRQRQMHLVNVASEQILAKSRDTASDANILTLSRTFRQSQCSVVSICDEVERCPTRHFERSACVMCEYENRRMVWRGVPPPTFPGIVWPWPAHWPKHISA